MLLKLAKRMLFETDKRLLWKLAWNMGFKGMLSVEDTSAVSGAARSSRRSCTSRSSTAAICAARAAGWTWPPSRRRRAGRFHKLIREAKAIGNVFFGIVGGEPFMHPS